MNKDIIVIDDSKAFLEKCDLFLSTHFRNRYYRYAKYCDEILEHDKEIQHFFRFEYHIKDWERETAYARERREALKESNRFFMASSKTALISLLNAYIPERVLKSIVNNKTLPSVGDYIVGFCDIRSFTRTQNSFDPEKQEYLINQFIGVTGRILKSHDITIDKYIGDCVMYYTETKKQNTHAVFNFVSASAELIKGMEEINKSFRKKYMIDPEIRCGVGICAGAAALGTFGSDEKVKTYTLNGNCVNLASRLAADSAGSSYRDLSGMAFARIYSAAFDSCWSGSSSRTFPRRVCLGSSSAARRDSSLVDGSAQPVPDGHVDVRVGVNPSVNF